MAAVRREVDDLLTRCSLCCKKLKISLRHITAVRKMRTKQLLSRHAKDRVGHCLQCNNIRETPPNGERCRLLLSLLHSAKSCLAECWTGNCTWCKTRLESVYPKLATGGGFELLRSGSPRSKLLLITPSTWGIFSSILTRRCRTWPSTGLHQATPKGFKHVRESKYWTGKGIQDQLN